MSTASLAAIGLAVSETILDEHIHTYTQTGVLLPGVVYKIVRHTHKIYNISLCKKNANKCSKKFGRKTVEVGYRKGLK